MTAPQLRQPNQVKKIEDDVCLFGQTNFRNQLIRFGIKTDDRRRHMYIIGKTGMGKTTMMENMVLNDIYKGHGVGIVDPHGDFAEKIIDYIPSRRINDVVYFNPSDTDNPIGFNILEVRDEKQKHLVASGLMAIFKKIWPDVWSSRMEYILNNTLLALLDYPGSTLLGINRLLADKKYRKRVVAQLTDPVIKAFWQGEFANYSERYMTEAVAPIQNKIGQFLSASVIRNMVAQVKSTINIRQIMDNKKIFIMNLSKGRIGEDNSRLLGGMLITKIQLAAMERVDLLESERKDFFLYVDEFQNFANPSFANILSEARKYRLSLILAHQYVKQIDELVADAVFGNVGTMISFRVGGPDSIELVKEFTPTFIEEDIVNLPKYQIFLKLMIDGVASRPFSAMTMPPIGKPTGSHDKVVRVSRERYSTNKDEIEDKITRWSGLDTGPQGESSDDEKKGQNNKRRDDRPRQKQNTERPFEKKPTEVRSEIPKIELVRNNVSKPEGAVQANVVEPVKLSQLRPESSDRASLVDFDKKKKTRKRKKKKRSYDTGMMITNNSKIMPSSTGKEFSQTKTEEAKRFFVSESPKNEQSNVFKTGQNNTNLPNTQNIPTKATEAQRPINKYVEEKKPVIQSNNQSNKLEEDTVVKFD